MKTAGKILIAFGTLNTLVTLTRLYVYFFTGKDITPLTGDAVLYTTVGMIVASCLSYAVGIELLCGINKK